MHAIYVCHNNFSQNIRKRNVTLRKNIRKVSVKSVDFYRKTNYNKSMKEENIKNK